MFEARSKSRFLASSLVPVLAIGALMVASSVAIITLQSNSAGQYRTAVELDELAIDTHHMFTSAWRAVLGSQPQPPYLTAEAYEVEKQYSIQLLSEAAAEYDNEVSERHDSDVRTSLLAFGEQSKAALALLREGRGDEALGVIGQANATYYPLFEQVHESSARYAAGAEDVRRLTQIASVATLALTFLGVSALYLRHRSVQRKADEAMAESEILRRSEARFRPLVQSSSDVILVLDTELCVQYVSPAINRYWGLAEEDLLGRNALEFVQPEEQRVLAGLYREVKQRPGYSQSAEMRIHYSEDSSRSMYIQVVCTNCLEDPDVRGLVLNVRDITDRKELEEQLRHQAFHDSLTGLSNRLRFTDRLDHAVERGRRSGGTPVSVLYLDLDYFKNVNDEMGHSSGDDLLKQVADRIRQCIGNTDTAARLSGDEFAILLEGHFRVEDARAAAIRILKVLKQPFLLGDREVHIGASIGVVVADPYEMTADEIVHNADMAMYDAKEHGRGRIHVYEPSMQFSMVERAVLMNDLNGSVERGELKVYYQPALRLNNQQVAGFEALVRWEHPRRGLLTPGSFIPLAEESGYIHDLGYFVLHEACRQMREWQLRYPEMDSPVINVNVSAHQIQKPGFVQLVRQVLDETGIDPAYLVLELTESVLIRNSDEVIDTLRGLKALGLNLALDDFGTGYSSLGYLKQFPIDILKIDRAFIEAMNDSDRDRMMVQTVIDLGHMLRLEMVAEGIERDEQLSSLLQLNCTQGQGFLFSHAVNASDAEVMLRAQAQRSAASIEEVA